MIKTPNFWLKKNLISYALLPLSAIYFVIFSLNRILAKKGKISKPIICIGNITAGGSGKTPTAIAIGKILQEMSINFAFLSRGYMNDGSKFLMLEKGSKNDAKKVGDEPILLSQFAPTFVAQNRFFGASQIDSMNKFQAVVLDDGMQNNKLESDFLVMVVDGNVAFGNGFLIPAGPMREPLCLGLKRANIVVVIGEMNYDLEKKLSGKKIVTAKILPLNLEKFLGKKFVAFCGLAYPQKFFSYLQKNGLEIVQTKEFCDHHPYKISELEELERIAKEQGVELIATKKDWVKFPKSFQEKISYLDVELKFDDEQSIKDELQKIL